MSQPVSLAAGIKALGIDPAPDLIAGLQHFAEELIKWNRTYNLTAIKDAEQVTSHHLLDSLSIYPFLAAKTVVDVGAGGGLPGIPLAMLLPDVKFTLLDSNGKKTRFMQQMVINHQLANCQVVQSRVEDFQGQFDLVTCRAFASLADISQKTAHLLAPGGKVLAMKGRLEEELTGQLSGNLQVAAVHKLDVPGLEAERHLVILEKNEA